MMLVRRIYIAEFIASALLLAAIVGSGIMAERLAGGNVAIALLGNAIATGAMLVVLITIFGPISGAHFNPVVSLVMLMRGQLRREVLAGDLVAQVAGGIAGVVVAHAMFGLPLLQASATVRIGTGSGLRKQLLHSGWG